MKAALFRFAPFAAAVAALLWLATTAPYRHSPWPLRAVAAVLLGGVAIGMVGAMTSRLSRVREDDR